MRRVRWFVTMAVLAVALFLATNPVFAAGNDKGGKGGGKGPGDPALPEAPVAILLPLVAIVVIGITFSVLYLRRRSRATAAE